LDNTNAKILPNIDMVIGYAQQHIPNG
jgi:hypothetical protein